MSAFFSILSLDTHLHAFDILSEKHSILQDFISSRERGCENVERLWVRSLKDLTELVAETPEIRNRRQLLLQ